MFGSAILLRSRSRCGSEISRGNWDSGFTQRWWYGAVAQHHQDFLFLAVNAEFAIGCRHSGSQCLCHLLFSLPKLK